MAIPSIQPVNVSSFTFGDWVNKTNEIIVQLQNSVVTASIGGDTTTGNATLVGNFTTTELIGTTAVRTNLITPRSGFTSIGVQAQVGIESSAQNILSLTSAAGPRIQFTSGSSVWQAGFFTSGTSAFIIGTSASPSLFSISQTGDVTANTFIGNLTGSATSAATLQTSRSITASGDLAWTVNFNGSANVSAVATISNNAITTAKVADNAISNAKFRQSGSLSVVGNSSNTSGNVADISAATDNSVLRRSGTTLGFGAINIASSNAVTGVLPFANGGTGASSFTANRVMVSGATSLVAQSNLIWDTSNNRLGIGITPTQTLHVSGIILASGDIIAFSDARLKTNVKTIPNALEKVLSLRGVSFTKDGRESVGLIAQELEKVLPEAVYDGEYKSVAYGNLVGLLVEAIKELKAELDANTNK